MKTSSFDPFNVPDELRHTALDELVQVSGDEWDESQTFFFRHRQVSHPRDGPLYTMADIRVLPGKMPKWLRYWKRGSSL